MGWIYALGVSITFFMILMDIAFFNPPKDDGEKQDRIGFGIIFAAFCPITIWFIVPATIVKTLKWKSRMK